MSDRTRSFWGWGYADRFPDRDTRRALGQQVEALLGFRAQEPLDPPPLEGIHLPPPRIPLPDRHDAVFSADPFERALHAHGRGYRDVVRGLEGDFRAAPDLVAFPRDERDVAQVLDWASAVRIAVVPFGGGTSVVGGVECDPRDRYRGVVSLDLRHLDRVLEVDALSQSARIQAGASGPILEAQLARHGLSLRHYPQSFELSTLGGWIATRAGGHFSTVYTHIDDLVQSTRMHTPSGLFESRRLPGSGAGPSPDRLVCGSEGIFGVITEAWMRVFPRPRYRSGVSVAFRSFEAAVEAVRTIAQSRLHPSGCRLLDAREAQLNMLPASGRNVLLLGFESAHHPVRAPLDLALGIARGHGGEAMGEPRHREGGGERSEAEGAWRQQFLEMPYLFNTLISLGVLVDTFETAIPWSRFDALHADVVSSVEAALHDVCGGGRVTCRFTHVYPDGPAPYYTFLGPAKRGSELAQWTEIKAAASEALMRHGATITHHHAVGRVHRPWYDRQRPAPFGRVLQAVKDELDPAGVLNPGVLVD